MQGDRSWESHPFTIANAPAAHTPDTAKSKEYSSRGLLLYARVAGNFTQALNLDARQSSGIQTNVIVDGPYGGLSAETVELADYRNVILVAGGGGASFTIALLEDLVFRSLEQKACTTVVDFIWIVKVSLFKRVNFIRVYHRAIRNMTILTGTWLQSSKLFLPPTLRPLAFESFYM